MSTPDWNDGRIAEVLTRPLPDVEATDGWIALPPNGPVRMLVPRGTPAATAPAVRRLLGHGSLVRRLGAELGAQALRLGGTHLLRRRAGWDVAGDRLLAHARHVAGHGEAIGVVRLNAGRPNRKPVVQLLAPDLRSSLAYVKVGWDDLTAPLVRAETATLSTLQPPDGLEVPSVLGSADGTIATVAVAPVHQDGATHHATPHELARRATALFGGDDVPLGTAVPLAETGLVRAAAAEADRTDHAAAHELRGAVERFVEVHGALEVPTARWHGDFTTANVIVHGDRVAAWDWERSTPDAPVGLDAAYTLLSTDRPADAAAQLEHLGLVHGPALVRLALLTSAHRHVRAAVVGIPTSVDDALARLAPDSTP